MCQPGAMASIRFAIALMGVLGGCADDRMAGGNSSETPNTIAGRVVDSAGRPCAGDTVEIRPADWISDDVPAQGVDRAWRTTTDSQGRYRFEGVASGAYVVESRSGSTGFLSEAISVGRGRPEADLGVDTANPFLEVVGRVVADSSWIDDAAEVHVCGTDHVAALDRSGRFRLKALGAGKVRLLAILGSKASAARANDEFRLPREGLVAPRLLAPTRFEDEDYSRWPILRKARVRFSSSGWYLDGDFPLVPIRVVIDEAILPGPWPATGAGIRFCDSTGHKFPYQIESWDPVERRAEIWVRLDTANKGSDAHFLWMYAGRDDVPARSSGPSVFDTASGWLGVWHLSGADPWKDATANDLRLSVGSASLAPGLVGGGVAISPASRLRVDGAPLQGLQDASVSLWVKVDSMGGEAGFARLGDASRADSSDWVLGASKDPAGASLWFRTAGQLRDGAPVPKAPFRLGRWVSVGGVFGRGTPRVRTIRDDTSLVAVFADSFPAHAYSSSLVVGGGFSGQLDEIRLVRHGVHPSVVRMQWGADREGSPVLEWQP